MEFKYRAVDQKPPTNLSPSSIFSVFPEQAMQAQFPTPGLRPYPDLIGEAIQRENEKARIREEIIAAEVSRRRLLEAEVRREMAMERETAIRRAALTRLSFEETLTMQFNSRLPMVHSHETRWLQKPLVFPSPGHGGSCDIFPSLSPPLLQLPYAMGAEVKPPFLSNKDEMIIPPRSNPNLCGQKQNAITSANGASETVFLDLKKNVKQEWSCALCQVTATNERGLKEHLTSKRHKSKEASLRARKVAKLQKKRKKVSKFGQSTGNARSENAVSLKEKLFQIIDLTGESSSQEYTKDSKNKIDEQPSEAEASNFKTVGGMESTQEEHMEMKSKLWCDICLVGVNSEVVMKNHKKGKKHKARVQQLIRNAEAATSTTKAAAEATQ